MQILQLFSFHIHHGMSYINKRIYAECFYIETEYIGTAYKLWDVCILHARPECYVAKQGCVCAIWNPSSQCVVDYT